MIAFFNKRETRFELATATLGRWNSTVELLPREIKVERYLFSRFAVNTSLLFKIEYPVGLRYFFCSLKRVFYLLLSRMHLKDE